MAAFSNYLENKLLDHITKAGPAFEQPDALYVALFTVAPNDAGGGTEVSGGDYARQTITFGAAVDGVAANNDEITFPTATSAWGTIVATGIFDAATDGNLLFHGPMVASRTIGEGETFKFPIGNFTITLD